jgi:hypothetical protein
VGDGGVFRTPCADFSRPVEEVEYTCLLKSTFTEASHVRGLDEVDKKCPVSRAQGLQKKKNLCEPSVTLFTLGLPCANKLL